MGFGAADTWAICQLVLPASGRLRGPHRVLLGGGGAAGGAARWDVLFEEYRNLNLEIVMVKGNYHRLTQEDFLARAAAAHGFTYNYSLVEYSSMTNKVNIICLKHGEFKQRPHNHLQGFGCIKCGIELRKQKRMKSTADFIAKATTVHGARYDYSQAVYKGVSQSLAIICPRHGLFEQQASVHLMGSGCQLCGALATGRILNPTTTDFITRAEAVHGIGTYDYSKVEYVRRGDKVRIVCPIHGVFKQSPDNHYAGAGCAACGVMKAATYQRGIAKKSAAAFIVKAQGAHGIGTYDYSQVVYRRSKEKVTIICLVHGAFEQIPHKHISGHGCPKCRLVTMKLSWVDKAKGRTAILYILRVYNESEVFYKVGITCREIRNRFDTNASLGGYQYEILATSRSANAGPIFDWEQSILETFAHLRYRPKRPFGGATECFSEAEPILAIFPL